MALLLPSRHLYIRVFILSGVLLLLLPAYLRIAYGAAWTAHLKNAWAGEYVDFKGFDNETGAAKRIVPNIVHLLRIQSPNMSFVEAVCLRTIFINHGPELVYIHTDTPTLYGYYWDSLKDLHSRIKIKEYMAPGSVFGQPITSVFHSSDVARIQILMKYGGVFLDNDVYVVQPLHKFLHFEMALGWPVNGFMGTQVLIGHKRARFLRYWLECYRYYKPRMWYYNAGQMPTQKVLKHYPNLVHRVTHRFGVEEDLTPFLYGKKKWDEWKQMYTVHLLLRHKSYMIPDDPVKEFNHSNIMDYKGTFGEMARVVYYWNGVWKTSI